MSLFERWLELEDRGSLSHAEAARRLGVSRSTLTTALAQARRRGKAGAPPKRAANAGKTLPPMVQRYLQLEGREEMTYAEASQRLGVSLSGLTSSLARARRLGAEGVPPPSRTYGVPLIDRYLALEGRESMSMDEAADRLGVVRSSLTAAISMARRSGMEGLPRDFETEMEVLAEEVRFLTDIQEYARDDYVGLAFRLKVSPYMIQRALEEVA